MQFFKYASGSKGNLYEVRNNIGGRLLIECGLPWRKLQAALEFNLSGINGCLLTHAHLDHSKAITQVIDAGIDVYASAGTIDACGVNPTSRRVHLVSNNTLVRMNDGFDVLAFDVHHDCREPLGFIVRADDEFLLFATDTCKLTQRFVYPFAIVAIEASYDKNILADRLDLKQCHDSVAKRLLTSHMEWRNTRDYLTRCVNLSKCREIHLLHMSGDNINQHSVRKKIENELLINVY